MPSLRSCVGTVVALSAMMLSAAETSAAAPKLVRTSPIGGQRGGTRAKHPEHPKSGAA